MANLAGTAQTCASVFRSAEGRQCILAYYDQLLSQFDFAYQERYIETSFGKTYLLESGEPNLPPLFLFHGSTSNSASWFADIKELTRYFHVFSVDLIGDAGHSSETRLDMKTDGYAKWIAELFDRTGILKAAIMGNSLGAWMCLKFAAVFPEKVDKMVLLAASGIAPVRLSFVLHLVLFQLNGGKGAEAITRMVYGNDPIPKEVLDYMSILSAHYLPYTGEVPVLSNSELARLVMPVMYIGGEDDQLTPVPRCAARLKKRLAKPTIHVVKNTGHVIYRVLDRVIPFLTGHA